MDEIVADKEQRLVVDPCQRVGKAIAEIELGAVATNAPIQSLSLSCKSDLLDREGVHSRHRADQRGQEG